MLEKIKIGLVGVGEQGILQLSHLTQIAEFEIIGFFDPDSEAAAQATALFGISAWENLDHLILASDAILIATPVQTRFLCAKKVLKKSRALFISQPVAQSAEETRILLQISRESKSRIMVGHQQRHHPANIQLNSLGLKPLYIESQRLSTASGIKKVKSVIHELMFHDLNIILPMVGVPIKKIGASAVGSREKGPDLVNARIEFNNGTVANLTASRVSYENKEKMRIFQADNSLTVDFKGNHFAFHAFSAEPATGAVVREIENITLPHSAGSRQEAKQPDPLRLELEHFGKMIRNNEQPALSLEDALHSLQTAIAISEKIRHVSPS